MVMAEGQNTTRKNVLDSQLTGCGMSDLKQLYAYMGMMGLEPVDPLGAEDFAGIAVPTALF